MKEEVNFIFPYQNTIHLKALLEDIRKCENEVYFESAQGDRLSLRSGLSQFIIYSICMMPELTKGAVIRCTGEHDKQILCPYFKE